MSVTRQLCIVLAAAAPAAAQLGDVQVRTEGTVQIRTERNVQTRTDEQGRRALAYTDPGTEPGSGDLSPRGVGWQGLGPFGGDVQDVNVSPIDANIVLAGVAPASGAGGTLFRSTDGGQTWTEVSALSGKSVYDVEFDPAGAAYIGTIDGVWKSTDGGATFVAQDLGIGLNDQVFDVAIDPNNASNLWAGVADAIGFQATNLMRSMDGGATWFDATPPLAQPQSGSSIAISADSSVVAAAFAGAFGGGQVWVSTDGGATWSDRSFGLPNTPVNQVLFTGTRLLVGGGQLFGSQLLGLYESTDNGVTWNPLHDGTWPDAICTGIAVDPNNPSVVLAATTSGVHRSIDGGATWEISVDGTEGASMNSVRFAPGSSTAVFGGASSRAVLRSTDGGTSFALSSAGIGALDIFSIAADPNNSDNVAIAFQGLNDGGIYTTTDGGVNWTLEACPGTRWALVRYAPDGTLYGISDGPTSIAAEALYRRESDGSWTLIGPDQGPSFESELGAARFSEVNPNLIMLGGNDFGVAGWDMTIWRSVDAGATWTKVVELFGDDFRSVSDVQIVQDGTDQTMVACFSDFGGDQIGGAFRSTDNGVTWAESSAGLPIDVQPFALAPSAASVSGFFLADSRYNAGGLDVSTDAGQTWSGAGFVGPTLDVVSDASDAQVLYILQRLAPKVQRSEDGGATFAPFDEGLESAGASRDLFLAPGSPARLYMATGTGAYRRDLAAACAADLTGDAVVDVFDLLSYLDLWFPGDAAAELTGDDPASIDVFDLLAYLDTWFAGCN